MSQFDGNSSDEGAPALYRNIPLITKAKKIIAAAKSNTVINFLVRVTLRGRRRVSNLEDRTLIRSGRRRASRLFFPWGCQMLSCAIIASSSAMAAFSISIVCCVLSTIGEFDPRRACVVALPDCNRLRYC
jgi:hypothetical protein